MGSRNGNGLFRDADDPARGETLRSEIEGAQKPGLQSSDPAAGLTASVLRRYPGTTAREGEKILLHAMRVHEIRRLEQWSHSRNQCPEAER